MTWWIDWKAPGRSSLRTRAVMRSKHLAQGAMVVGVSRPDVFGPCMPPASKSSQRAGKPRAGPVQLGDDMQRRAVSPTALGHLRPLNGEPLAQLGWQTSGQGMHVQIPFP
mmetsp:Transcript_125708/g.367301  ORF Transcript_125708/g.367301 Transcript_125708/m.367301 type:complete len:110 (-) Transcript_125708:1242-1571(-)